MLRRLIALLIAAFLGWPCFAFDWPARGVTGSIETVALPDEARATLQRIRQGGPSPYRKDGTVFQNRETRLPAQAHGYYREYTVPTPGLRDRGARRIIAGSGGDLYYTDDHYRTFRRIRE